MLVTGSRKRDSDTQKGLSIWLRQGGQSFYESLSELPNGTQRVRVVVEGADCVPFPKVLTESINVEALLATAGVSVSDGAEIIVCSNDTPVCYALTVATEDTEAVRRWAAEGTEITYTTPLAASVRRAVVGSRHSKTLALQFGHQEVYVALSVDGTLSFADVVMMGGEEELLRFMAVLNEDFDLRKADIFISGVEGKSRTKLLGRYFRRCKWEKDWADVYNK